MPQGTCPREHWHLHIRLISGQQEVRTLGKGSLRSPPQAHSHLQGSRPQKSSFSPTPCPGGLSSLTKAPLPPVLELEGVREHRGLPKCLGQLNPAGQVRAGAQPQGSCSIFRPLSHFPWKCGLLRAFPPFTISPALPREEPWGYLREQASAPRPCPK